MRLKIFIIVIAVLGTAAFFATKYKWFESGQGDISRDIEIPVFPTVNYSDDEPSRSVVDTFPDDIPEYSGYDTVVLDDNRPNFTQYDLEHIAGESFSELDSLGRCGTAVAMIDYTMMPTDPREDIGDVKPSGWKQEKYPGIVNSKPPYLYNRCHLIAYMLTGQNAKVENLITGTRYFNSELMLQYENQVAHYLYEAEKPDEEGRYDRVLYRVTPYFKGKELVARGVEIEAYSVEDKGDSLSIHVFIYNVQPGIEIDYKTGESRVEQQ